VSLGQDQSKSGRGDEGWSHSEQGAERQAGPEGVGGVRVDMERGQGENSEEESVK
jgi:hypothetical protein